MNVTRLSVFLVLILAVCCVPIISTADSIDNEYEEETTVDISSKSESSNSEFAGMSAVDLNNLGGTSLINGDLAAAVRAYQAAMTEYPDDPVAYYNLGFIFIDYLLDTQNGIPLLQKAVELDPENGDSWFYLGTAYVLDNDHTNAYNAFRRAVNINPLNDAAWYFLGMSAEVLGNIDEALQAFDEALVINPANTLVHQSKGVIFSVRGEHEKALESLRKADSESLIAQFYIGASNLELGNTDLALESFQKVSRMTALDSLEEGFITTALYNIGVIQSAAGDTRTATSTLRQAAERSDDPANSWLHLGRAYLDEENFSDAIYALNRAIQANPENGAAYFFLGNALADTGDNVGAFNAFTSAVTYDPDNSMAWENLGIVLFLAENYVDAAPALADAVRLDPENGNAWGYFARSLWYNGDEKGAIQAFDRAFELIEPYAGLLNDYGAALNDVRRYDEALAAFDRAIALDSSVPDFWFNKGNVLNNLGEPEQSLAAYQRAVSIEPSPLGYNHIGLLYLRLQDYENALRAFDSALNLNDRLADVWTSKAQALFHLGRNQEALQAVESALAVDDFAPAREFKAIIEEQLAS